ncbi:MAG: hypothetical protein Q4F55_05320 [Bacillota bacterium]|nr:hypothetical protein [Bacillota bacterium]
MNEDSKRVQIDKMIILCGVIGAIIDVVAIVCIIIGKIPFDVSYIILLPVSVFFIFYGRKLVKKDSNKFGK